MVVLVLMSDDFLELVSEWVWTDIKTCHDYLVLGFKVYCNTLAVGT